jgi:hypothetical protein
MAVALLFVLGACSDRGDPVAAPAPGAPAPLLVASVLCQANRQAATVRCGDAPLPSSARGYILVGGQGVYTQLTSSNVAYNAGTQVFSFDVTVQNLIPQPLGTTDGTAADGTGVRVIFASGVNVTDGSGNASVGNADGMATYTNTNQPYFQYSGAVNGADGILSTSETSGTKNWQLNIDNTVNTFSFVLYVAAEVPFPNGWIDVTPAAPNVLQGSTQALTATVRSAVGKVLTGQTVTWGTTNAAVATVDGSGVATGAGVGSASITATSGLRSGSAALGVCPNLAVGGTYTGVMPLVSSLCFGGGAGAEEFTYMPVNLSSSSSLSLTVTGTGIQAVTGPPSPDKLPGGGPVLGNVRANDPAIDEDFRARLLANDRELAARAFRSGNALIRRTTAAPGGPRRLITVGTPSVGDLMNLNVAQGCSGALDTRVGQVRSVGQHVIVVSDTSNPAGGFTTAQYDSIALEFDSLAYATDTTNFNGPTDLDTNGRVVAFYTRAVNELSPPASSVVVLGFFTARDLFSSAPASCPRSNEGEMFYMLVPDPTGAVNSNVRTVSFVRGSTVGTMAHELQHLINASRRVYENGTWNGLLEEVWLNEGLSHIAEELVFYRASVGLAPRGNIVVTQLTTGPNASRRVAAFNTYANARVAAASRHLGPGEERRRARLPRRHLELPALLGRPGERLRRRPLGVADQHAAGRQRQPFERARRHQRERLGARLDRRELRRRRGERDRRAVHAPELELPLALHRAERLVPAGAAAAQQRRGAHARLLARRGNRVRALRRARVGLRARDRALRRRCADQPVRADRDADEIASGASPRERRTAGRAIPARPAVVVQPASRR